MAPIKCKEYRLKTEVVRSLADNVMGMKTEYLCRKCNISSIQKVLKSKIRAFRHASKSLEIFKQNDSGVL